MTIIYVAFGGALGAVLRYLVTLGVAFPFGTLIVNVMGSFLMGLAFVWFTSKATGQAQFLVMTGLLGGFTTFSAFSLDVLKLVDQGRWAFAGQYILGSVILSLVAIFTGVALMKALST